MDSRDSSSNSGSRDGVCSSQDDDGVISVTASLAKEASSLFQSDKFSDSVEALNRLLQKKEGDPKILHNIAVAEFLRDGCSDPKKLMEVLVDVKRKCEALACAPRDETDCQAGNRVMSGSKGPSNLGNGFSPVFADEFDASVAALNIATVLFHLHEFPKALSVLESLFQTIEPIDETTALHICLLLLDIAFATQDVSKISDVINYLDKSFGVSNVVNQGDSGSTGHQQASNLVMKASVGNNSSASDDFGADGTAAAAGGGGGGSVQECSLSRTLSDETIEYESLLSTLDISGHNTPRPPNISSANDLSRAPADRSSTPTINLKLHLPLYKIQLLLLTRNLKAAKRDIKQAMNIARGIDSSRILLLKSQLEYARGNYPKAFKLLRASSSQADVGSSVIINNNVGCIYYQQGKHHTSSIFFHKALNICSSLWKEKPKKLVTFSEDKSVLVAYNCGLQYLACGKPLLAARCLWKASLVFYNKPLLWLRLAECCLMALEKGLLKRNESSVDESGFRVQVFGQGKWRQLAMVNGYLGNGDGFSNESMNSSISEEGDRKPKLSLPFARQCLVNALYLLGNSEPKHVKSSSSSSVSLKSSPEENESSESAATPKNSGHRTYLGSNDVKPPSMGSSGQVSGNGDARDTRSGSHANVISEYVEMICRRENQKMKQAILVDLCFVELELGNPVKALSAALSLLNLSECSKMHSFLGRVYSAEALCLLNRPKEAAEHLSCYFSGGNDVEFPYTDEDCREWEAKKTIMDAEDSNTCGQRHKDNMFLCPQEARGALYVNVATMLIMQGDVEQANRFVNQALATIPSSQKVVMTAVYVNLKLGNALEALTKLKTSRVRFFPLTSTSKAAF